MPTLREECLQATLTNNFYTTHRNLYHHGEKVKVWLMFCNWSLKVDCLDLEDALAAFLEWLEVCIQSFLKRKNLHPLTNLLTQELGGDVVLVAHKCLDYDAKVEIILKCKSSLIYFFQNKRLYKLLLFNRCSCATWKNSTSNTVISSG